MIPTKDGRKIVRSWPGAGTGETVYQDDQGTTYREITEAEAQNVRQTTCGVVYRICRDGRVR